METMKLLTAELVPSNKMARVAGGVYITFISDDHMIKDDLVRIGIKKMDRSYYFNVVGVKVAGNQLEITARETGYWAGKLDHTGVDLREIIGAGIIPVTEQDKIDKIRKESCYC